MKPTALIMVLAGLVLTGLLLLPQPWSPAPTAQGTHQGEIACPFNPTPAHDGTIQPGEYAENFFDPRSKVLVHFACPEDGNRLMHVGLISPWSDWTEFRFQTADPANGDYNVLRLRILNTSLEVEDALWQASVGAVVNDLDLGGTFDVTEPAGMRTGEYAVYEFAFPLNSPDPNDSQLAQNGSFNFQVVGTRDSLEVQSADQFIEVGEHILGGIWTEVGVSLPTGNAPRNASEIIVSLRDDSFNPLPFRSVSVFVRTVYGYLDLGRTVTNAQGLASVQYTPRGNGEYLIGASFGGEGGYLASVAWATLTVTSPAELPSPLADLRVVETLIFVIVTGVWATYGYALFVVGRSLYGRSRAGRQTGSRGGSEST